jgi:seryl-tRNA synthetase
MCYHTYHQLSGKEVDNRVITARGKSFRYESKYHRSLERLWDFTIREIVFLGTKDFVLDCRRRLMDATFALLEDLKLEVYCEVANDPFFCRPDTAVKIFSQRMMELKYELRMNTSAAGTISVGSFNYHEQFFAENFTLKSPGEDELIFTGCAGFGLERLVYAFLCQYGLDREHWPETIRKALN